MWSPVTKGVRGAARGRRSTWLTPVAAAFLVLPMVACEGLLDVDLPGSLTEEALRDPALSETLVTSAVGDFECGFVDMWYPGQWFEMFQNTGTGRPNALSQFRSQLVGVYADPCASGTGPIWTTIQVPRAAAERAVDFIRSFTFTPSTLPDTTFLIAKARLYEGYSIQLLAEQFCAVTFNAGPLITREAAYDSAEVKFTEAITKGLTVTGSRAAEAGVVVNAARVGRARARLYQWQYSGGAAQAVIDDALLVTSGFQLTTTYDDNPGRRRNRIRDQITSRSMMPYRDDTNLALRTADGMPVQGIMDNASVQAAPAGAVLDPRVRITIATGTAPDVDGRGVYPMRRQTKMPNRASPIPFSTWREAQLMRAEVETPANRLVILNNLRTVTTGLASTIITTGTSGLAAFPLPQISAVTWAALTPAQQDTVMWEERRRELYLQGTQPGDKIRWAYPAWDQQDEYGAQVRDVSAIDDPLTPGADAPGCIPVPYLERTSNLNLIPLLP